MRLSKKLISIICSLAIVLSTAAIVMTTSASAETNTVAYKFNSLDHNFSYGEWVQKIEYTSGGYVTIKDSDRFGYQIQARWDFNSDKSTSSNISSVIESALNDYQGMLAMDVTMRSAEMLKPNGTVEKNNWFQARMDLFFKYKDPENIDEEDNPEGWTYSEFKYIGTPAKLDQTVTVKIMIDDYTTYKNDYDGFEFIAADIHVMNYSMQGSYATEGEYKGQPCGVGNVDVTFSPFYIYGTTAPAMGEDLGEDFSFIPNAEDPTMGAGTFVIGGKEYPQQPLVEGATKRGDGKYGNGKSIDWANIKTFLLGDVNFDGKVNAIDLLMIKKYIVNIGTVDTTIADVNSDTKVNAIDLLIIKKYIVKIDAGPWGTFQ